jgi:ABC-type sugar transport system ATPase subunit
MVYVTHDQAEAMTLATRIAILQHGEIVQVGAPLELYRRPVNTFVATFLGNPAMNLLPAQVGRNFSSGENGHQIGIRPEDVQLATSPASGWDAGRVLVFEPMGSESVVTVEQNGHRVVARVTPDVRVEPGQQVWMRLPPDRVLKFDAEGRRA